MKLFLSHLDDYQQLECLICMCVLNLVWTCDVKAFFGISHGKAIYNY